MLIRFDQFRDYNRLADQFDQIWRRPSSTVAMDAYRHGNEVTVERDVLTISANREWDHNEDDEVFAAERPHGTYTRRVLLGDSLDSSNLQASYDHGVLTVTLPVSEQAQPRKIAIGSGNGRALIEASTSN
jgi:HSP20 family protein